MNMVSLTYKLECPLLNTNMLIGKIYFKKKAYITWKDNAYSLTSLSNNIGEKANLCLLANQYSKTKSLSGSKLFEHVNSILTS